MPAGMRAIRPTATTLSVRQCLPAEDWRTLLVAIIRGVVEL